MIIHKNGHSNLKGHHLQKQIQQRNNRSGKISEENMFVEVSSRIYIIDTNSTRRLNVTNKLRHSEIVTYPPISIKLVHSK